MASTQRCEGGVAARAGTRPTVTTGWWWWLAAAVVVVAATTLADVNAPDGDGVTTDEPKPEPSFIAKNLLLIVDYVQSQGDAGVFIYTGVLAVAIVICLPCTLFEIVPGFLFGARRGAVVCVIGKNIGNVVCVLLAKTVLSGYVRKNLLPRLQNTRVIERMGKRQGFVAILIFRGLVYAPLPLKNYGLGVLDIPAWQTIGAAVITGTPYCIWWAYLGSKAKNLAEILDGQAKESMLSMPENPLLVAALGGAALLVLRKIAVAGTKAWEEAKAELESEDGSGGAADAAANTRQDTGGAVTPGRYNLRARTPKKTK